MASGTDGFSERDLAYLKEWGVSPARAERQLEVFRNPPRYTKILKPCVPGDGIHVFTPDEAERYRSLYDQTRERLSVVKFVPASGAASRMFRSLLTVHGDESLRTSDDLRSRATGGDGASADCLEFMQRLGEFAFSDDLQEVLRRAGGEPGADAGLREVLAALLEEDGLDYAALPKALLKFHGRAADSHTAFEEHLIEAAHYGRGRGGLCRLHLTVSPEHTRVFRALLERVAATYEKRFNVRYEVEFSLQKPSTDSVAVTTENEPFRDGAGCLLLRPGGHGALIENLAEIDADLVFVKNIDNIVPESQAGPTYLWKQVLAGLLVELQERVFAYLAELESGAAGGSVENEALAFATEYFGAKPAEGTSGESLRAFLIDRLDRPLRACGMVINEGDPGGGPFWVRDRNGGVSNQIVETAQIDASRDGQRKVLGSATHFNPVDLVCATRDRKGRRFPLANYVDDDAVFIAEKSHEGRTLKSLELPGLWNGAMSDWNTVFVEVPIETFNPVKAVNDLLGSMHQEG